MRCSAPLAQMSLANEGLVSVTDIVRYLIKDKVLRITEGFLTVLCTSGYDRAHRVVLVGRAAGPTELCQTAC
jgi:hypothetical protein